MGSELSQSQELRNTFPLSEYKLLPSDKNFPNLTFLQKLSDSSVLAVKAVDKGKGSYEPSCSKHVIRRLETKNISNKTFEIYEWANANVQGLVEYINFVDKNRKISKAQFNAIVEGAVKGFSAVSKDSFQIECLEINMKKLRIFNEISLKNASFNSKEVVNSINVKIIPKSLNDCLEKEKRKSELWNHVGECIHQDGIKTEKELLGDYLLQLSNYATKKDFKTKQEGMKNLKANFGTKSFKAVEGLLANEDWKTVVKILDTNWSEDPASSGSGSGVSPLKEIDNKIKTNNVIQMNHNDKPHETQKTIDSQKNRSEKDLFKVFKSEQNTHQHQGTRTPVQSPPKEIKFQTFGNNTNVVNSPLDRSRINSTQYYRSVSPLRSDKLLSPVSVVKIVREMSPPMVQKVYERQDDHSSIIDNLRLTRANSIMTVYPPDIQRDDHSRNRMISTKNINIPTLVFSPEGRKMDNQYQNSPRIQSPRANQPRILSPRMNETRIQSPRMNETKLASPRTNQHIIYEAQINDARFMSPRNQRKSQIQQQQQYVSPRNQRNQRNQRNERYEREDREQQRSQILYQQSNPNHVEKRKGKKVEFKPCKPNPTLKEPNIPDYQWKIKVDKVEDSKKFHNNHNDQKGRSDSFLSQEFSSLNFELSDKYFNTNESKNSKPSFSNDQKGDKQGGHKSPKIEIKGNGKNANSNNSTINNNHSEIKGNHNHQEVKNHSQIKGHPQMKGHSFQQQQQQNKSQLQKLLYYPPRDQHNTSFEILEVNSETYFAEPESPMSFKKMEKLQRVESEAFHPHKDHKDNKEHKEHQSNKTNETKESKYVGSMNIKGQKEGEGKLYFPSGGYYVGTFYKDFMHGEGKLYYPCGKLAYEGMFKHDKFHGFGKIYSQSPTFIASFDFRNFNKLELTEKEQIVHKEHQLISGMQKEKKVSYWKMYEGEMSNDMKQGKGVLVLENGERYEGEFREDLVHGKGVFYGNNGKISGRWEDGLLMEVYR